MFVKAHNKGMQLEQEKRRFQQHEQQPTCFTTQFTLYNANLQHGVVAQ